jgi:hypothetical protein
VLDYDAPLADWASAVKRLWNDRQDYERLSAAALAFSKRPELDPARQLVVFLDLLERAARQGVRRAA